MSASRPASARPRQDGPTDHKPVPPSAAELEAIELQQTQWAALLGANVAEDSELGAWLVTRNVAGPGLNLVGGIRWPADEVDQRLAIVTDRLMAHEAWPTVIVADGVSRPADLSDRLRAAGWIAVAGERIMVARHPATVPHLDRSLRVEAVTPGSALECVSLETTVFGLPLAAVSDSAELLAQSVAGGTTRAFLLRLGSEAIASARLVPGSEVAGLHAIGVAPGHRRRGYGRMLTAIATRAGLATGHKLIWLSVDEENAPAVAMYRSLGFEPSFAWTRWAAPA